MGLLIADEALRVRFLDALLVLLPEPLQAPFVDVITTLVEQRWTISLLGLLGLLWGAAALYEGVDQSLAVLVPGGRVRGGLERRLRGLVLLLGLVVVVAALVLLTLAAPPLEGGLDLAGGVRLVLSAAAALVLVIGLILAAYRWVPVEAPSWRAAIPPAAAAGVAIWALTGLFGVLAPLLVRGYAAFGVFVSLLGALLWLNLVATAFLMGAAWTRARGDARAMGL